VRVEREAVAKSLALARDEGFVVIEARPKSGLTMFLAQVGSYLAKESGGEAVYVNAAVGSTPIFQRLGEKLGSNWGTHPNVPGILQDLAQAAPLVLLIDGLERSTAQEKSLFETICQAFRSERLFVPALGKVFVVLGTRDTWHGSKVRLGYFNRTEVATLLGRSPEDHVAQALYAWTAGAPELVREVAMQLDHREDRVSAVHRAVRGLAQIGRLRRIALDQPSQGELSRLGLAGDRIVPAMKLALKINQGQGSGLVINRHMLEARYQGRLIALFPQEARILCLLAANPGRILTAEQIYSEITGGQGLYAGEGSVKAQVSRLRQKLPPPSQWIITKRGIGYYFNPYVTFRLI